MSQPFASLTTRVSRLGARNIGLPNNPTKTLGARRSLRSLTEFAADASNVALTWRAAKSAEGWGVRDTPPLAFGLRGLNAPPERESPLCSPKPPKSAEGWRRRDQRTSWSTAMAMKSIDRYVIENVNIVIARFGVGSRKSATA